MIATDHDVLKQVIIYSRPRSRSMDVPTFYHCHQGTIALIANHSVTESVAATDLQQRRKSNAKQ